MAQSDTLAQGLAAVQSGEADAMLAELYQLQYPLRNNQLDGLDIRSCLNASGWGLPSATTARDSPG